MIASNESTFLRAHFRRMSVEQYRKIHWLLRGAKTLEERAAERIEQILAEHEPEALQGDAADAVHAIVERDEARHT
jgi:trimethylamine:corrinoid methyltransferase-like protein